MRTHYPEVKKNDFTYSDFVSKFWILLGPVVILWVFLQEHLWQNAL